jgi:class 3 adenylate cyclase
MPAGSIIVYPDSPDSYNVELEPGQTLEIGRKPTTTGNRKLVIPIAEVSGQHAEIRSTAAGWTIRDSGSTNGTKLNGDRLSPGKEYRLYGGDRIQVAHIDLLVDLPADLCQRQPESIEEQQDITHFKINLINATILVADIRGFTSLTEQYADQPEIVMQSTQLVFLCLKGEIEKQHGELEKVAGDAVMAYWQDDGSGSVQGFQACLTALRLRTLVRALAQRRDHWPFVDHPLEIDIALASGPVATGALGHAKGNQALLGDTANVAFRLEKLVAEDKPGDIIVDETTRNMAEEHFRFEWLGSYNIKGRQRPVEAYRLLGHKDTVQQ